MNLAVVALIFLLAAIVLGFVKKMNVGLVCLGLAFILGKIGNVPTKTILGGFPGSLFLTLLGTMFSSSASFRRTTRSSCSRRKWSRSSAPTRSSSQ